MNQVNASPLGSDIQKGKSVMCLTMNERLRSVLQNWLNKHDKMYKTRAYYSYYLGYGIESGGMSEAENDLMSLERDY